MRRQKKRILSILLTLCMVCSTISMPVYAAEIEESPTQEAGETAGNMEESQNDAITPTDAIQVITGFTTLANEVKGQQLEIGAAESDINLPESLSVTLEGGTESTVENITWKIDADNEKSVSDTFDSSEEMNGAYYTYVAELPEGYQLADGVEMPEIIVTVGMPEMTTLEDVTEADAVASTTINGVTTNHDSFDSAFIAVRDNGGTLTLLKNGSLSSYITTNIMTNVILDLNGHTLTLNNGLETRQGSALTITGDGKITSFGEIIKVSGTLTTQEGTANIDVGISAKASASLILNGAFTYGDISISSGSTVIITNGTFTSITLASGMTAASLLPADGSYCYYKDGDYVKSDSVAEGSYINNVTVGKLPVEITTGGQPIGGLQGTELKVVVTRSTVAAANNKEISYQWYKVVENGAEDAKVGENSSTYIANEAGNYYCIVTCANYPVTSTTVTVTPAAAELEKDTEVSFYSTLAEALTEAQKTENANCKVTLLADVVTTAEIKVTTGKFTLDFNSHTWNYDDGKDYSAGALRIASADVTLSATGGGGITFNGKILDGMLSLNSTGRLTINGGTYGGNSTNRVQTVVYSDNLGETGQLTIVGGTFISETGSTFSAWGCSKGSIVISGGTFQNRSDTSNALIYLGRDTNANTLADLLKPGCAFKTDGTWVTDTTGTSLTGSTITVEQAPGMITDQPSANPTLDFGSTVKLEVKIKVTEGVTGVTYQWADNGVDISGAENATYTTDQNMLGGAHSFTCKVSMGDEGFTVTTKPVAITVNYAEPSQDDQGVYQITNASNLMWFAAHVNDTNNTTNQSANAVLTADIDMTDITWTPIGKTDAVYVGDFDGQGHTITGLSGMLFGTAGKGSITNVNLTGGTFSGDSTFAARTGSLVGDTTGDLTLKNCTSSNDFKGTKNGDLGGLVGKLRGTIENCAFTGDISEASNGTIGAVVGSSYGDAFSMTMKNCYTTSGALVGWLHVNSTISNSLYTSANAYNNAGNGTIDAATQQVTADDFTNGKAAYLLNGSTSSGTLIWYQTLGEGGDAYPVLNSTHGIVYKDGETYTNIDPSIITFDKLTTLISTVETNINNNTYDGSYTTASIKLLKEALASAKAVESSATQEIISSSYNNLNNAVLRLVEKAFTVTLNADPATGGKVYNGGSFAAGESTTIKAEAATGYRFDGWYDGTSKVTADVTFDVATRTEDITYTAKFTQTNSLSINTVDHGTITLNGTKITSEYQDNVAVGTKITLNAAADEGYEFVYWMDGNNRVLSYQAEGYVTYVGMATTISGVFQKVKASDSDVCNYRFLNRNGDRVSSASTMVNTAVTKPSNPSLVGYTFVGWKIQGSADSELIDFTTFKITTNTVFVAVYAKETTTYQVQITDGTISGTDGLSTGRYEFDTKLTVVADAAQEGKVFSYWKNSKNEIVSYEESYSFYVGGVMSLTAVFEDKKIDAVPIISGVIAKTDNTNKIISFLFDREMPQDYTMIQTGCIATDDSTLGADSDSFVLGASGIDFTKVATSTNGTGQYIWAKGNVSTTWYVRGYLTYIDKDGITVTIYTDILTGSLSE